MGGAPGDAPSLQFTGTPALTGVLLHCDNNSAYMEIPLRTRCKAALIRRGRDIHDVTKLARGRGGVLVQRGVGSPFRQTWTWWTVDRQLALSSVLAGPSGRHGPGAKQLPTSGAAG